MPKDTMKKIYKMTTLVIEIRKTFLNKLRSVINKINNETWKQGHQQRRRDTKDGDKKESIIRLLDRENYDKPIQTATRLLQMLSHGQNNTSLPSR